MDRTTFQTFSYNTLYKAMIRNKEQTYRLMCPTSKLKRLLATETHDEEALNERITESYNTYAENHPSESLSTEVTRRHVSKTHMENAETDTFYGAPESDDFLSDDVKSSNCVEKRKQLPKSSRGEGHSKNDVLNSLVTDTDVVLLKDTVILDLKTKVDVMQKLMIEMAKEQKTGSQGRHASKRSAQIPLVIPASEQARCALLHQPNPVIDVTSDGDDSAFETEEIVSRQPKKGRRNMSRTSLDNRVENDGAAVRDTLKAPQRRIKNKRGNALRYWQDAKARNCTPHRIYEDIVEATADNMTEVLDKMHKLGFAVIRDYNKLCDKHNLSSTYSMFEPANAPTLEQANYYKNANQTTGLTKPAMDAIFEGVKVNRGNMRILPVKPAVAREGTELRAVMTYGTKQYKAYQKLCKGQGEDIVKGMFQKHNKKNGTNPKADPRNWFIAHNVVVGGQDHQHPHCDQGKVGSFAAEEVFPFVAIHGFGVNEFQMWLLPNRGDFSHAGACMQEARAHSAFFPQAEAGWDEEYPYWHPSCTEPWLRDPAVFLSPDYRSPPFG